MFAQYMIRQLLRRIKVKWKVEMKTTEASACFSLLLVALLALLAMPGGGGRACAERTCIVGSGISGASSAHFLRSYSALDLDIHVFEQNPVVGGRMALVDLEGDLFEAGGTIIHPKNLHLARFVDLLGLNRTDGEDEGGDKEEEDDDDFGIWDGSGFVFKTLKPSGSSPVSRKITQLLNSIKLLWRYKRSLFLMDSYTTTMIGRFMRFYEKERPVFSSVEEMLEWANLYELTQGTVEENLRKYGLSDQLINELVTVIMRINYGQDTKISGMAGAVSLGGSGSNLWAVKEGNWQVADGLIKHSNATLHVNETVASISWTGNKYQLNVTSGSATSCDAVIVATSLDESQIHFNPPISIPKRYMQHTFATFVRGVINPDYFGMKSVENVPTLIGTLENPLIPFSSINILKSYGSDDKAYKVFSRAPLSDDLLDRIFRKRSSTVSIDWAAYPHFSAPENFAPLILDGKNLYYVNAFENAASAMETGAVSAENVVRLLVSRTQGMIKIGSIDQEEHVEYEL